MCLTFFYQTIKSDQSDATDGYRLILANNRDEYWDRPTKEAGFWGENNTCIGGLDLVPGREGGTWLGMNKEGKIGILLNILGQQDNNKLGRGYLVTNFVSQNPDMDLYASRILKDKDKYNGFNLLLFDIGKPGISQTDKTLLLCHAPSYSSVENMRTLPNNTVIGVSNSPMEKPFQKVLQGKTIFNEIISKYPTVGDKPAMIESLMRLMEDEKQYMPDPVLQRAALSAGYETNKIGPHSSISIWAPQWRCGSRTTTLILVDNTGKVDFIERTLDISNATSRKRTTITYNFPLVDEL